MSSRWQQISPCQPPSSSRQITGSLTPIVSSPGKAGRTSAAASPSRSPASSAPIHQCLLPGVARHTYIRQRPSSVRTSAGRSIDIAPKCDSSSSATVVSDAPSSDRAITFSALPSCPLRTRYAIAYEPSGSSAAVDEPDQKPGPAPGAGAATSWGADPGSGSCPCMPGSLRARLLQVSLQRGIDGSDPVRRDTLARNEEIRYAARTWVLGTGTLACPHCDAPVMPARTVRRHRAARLSVLRPRRRGARLPLARRPVAPRAGDRARLGRRRGGERRHVRVGRVRRRVGRPASRPSRRGRRAGRSRRSSAPAAWRSRGRGTGSGRRGGSARAAGPAARTRARTGARPACTRPPAGR